MNTTTVASLDQKSDVSVHERNSHGDIGTVRKHKARVVTEFLDEGKDVIPSAAVKTGAVVTEFIDDLQLVSIICYLFEELILTSSISKAAVIVSIRTVPRIVPRGIPM